MKIALIQMPIFGHDYLRHLEAADALCRQALAAALEADGKAPDLYLLPELWATGYAPPPYSLEPGVKGRGGWIPYGDMTDELLARAEGRMKRLARELDAAVGGTLPAAVGEEEGGRGGGHDGSGRGRWYNRFFFYYPDGRPAAAYDKVHLFRPGGEDGVFAEGRRSGVVVAWRGLKFCLQICFDLRFPESARNALRASGDGRPSEALYDVVLYSCAWPARRIDAFDALLRARAIENQAYAVGVNFAGESPEEGPVYNGHSAVCSPSGRSVGCFLPAAEREAASMGAGIVLAEIGVEELRRLRRTFPVLREGLDEPFRS